MIILAVVLRDFFRQMEPAENVLQDVPLAQSHQLAILAQIQTETLTATVPAMSVFMMQELINVLPAIQIV